MSCAALACRVRGSFARRRHQARAAEPPRALWLHTDGVLMERVLRNLIGNAVKYAAEGNILIAVRMLPDGGVGIEVRDAGRGIAEADQRRF